MPISETSRFRDKVVQYCQGNGIDCGSGGDPVVPTAIQIDLPVINYGQGPMVDKYPVQLKGDATRLYWFKDGTLDYVFSSHLLEDFADWVPVLSEWIRVIRSGGYLVILMPEKNRWEAALRRGQPPNLAHKHEAQMGELPRVCASLGVDTIMEELAPDPDYNLTFVGRKR